MKEGTSIFENEISPYTQGTYVVIGGVCTMVLAKLVVLLGIIKLPFYYPWVISASFLMLFAIINAVLSLASKNQNEYWGKGITTYMGVGIITGVVAYLLSGSGLFETKSFSWIYVVFTLGYILFLVMVRSMRKIMRIAEEQERRMRQEQ